MLPCSVYPVLPGGCRDRRCPVATKIWGSSSPSQGQQDGGRQGASPSPAWGGVQPVAGWDLLCVIVGHSPTFPTLSSLGVMESPPAAPHCLPIQLQHIPHPSPALQTLRRARKSNTNHKKNPNKPSPCGLFGVAALFANELGGSLGKKRACLVNPISLPQ